MHVAGFCVAGVLQTKRLLAVCVVRPLRQPPPRLARRAGMDPAGQFCQHVLCFVTTEIS